MSELITRSARLIPYVKRPRNATSFTTAYRYEPLPGDPGSILGNLYVVIEVLVPGRSGEELADLIIETAGEHYYNRPHEQEDHLLRFEEAIKAVNHALMDHVSKGSASWIGKLSAVIAIQVDNELHVSQTGSADAYLYRGRNEVKITARNNDKPASPSKTFGFVASGILEAGDRILITTPAMTHQIATDKIHEIVMSGSPNMAISELTELLKNVASERMASVVIETITAESAAMQVRPESPDEATLGVTVKGDPLESVMQSAGPLASATLESGRKLGQAAKENLLSKRPKINLSLGPTRKKLPIILGVSGVILAAAAGAFWYNAQNAAVDAALLTKYDGYYQNYVSLTAKGDSAREQLVKLQQDLTTLASSKDAARLNKDLAQAKLAAGEPKTIAELASKTTAAIDGLDKLHRVAAKMVADTNAGKASQPQKLEVSNGKAYVFDSTKRTLYIIKLSDGSVVESLSKYPTADEKIVATTLSSNKLGIYLLTDGPSVWFYKFSSDSIAEVKVGAGVWPKATAISSYIGNLYLSSADTIYKATPSGAGFNDPISYLDGTDGGCINGVTSLAAHGSVYVASSSNICEYLTGVQKNSTLLPAGLAGSALSLKVDGSQLLIISAKNQRLGLWNVTAGPTFTGQYQLKDTASLDDGALDSTNNVIYALIEGRLYSFKP